MNANAPLLSERFPAPNPGQGSRFRPGELSNPRLALFRSNNPLFDRLLEQCVKLQEEVTLHQELRLGRGKPDSINVDGTGILLVPTAIAGNQHVEFNLMRLAHAAFPEYFLKPKFLRFSGYYSDSHGHIYFDFSPSSIAKTGKSNLRQKPLQREEYLAGEGSIVISSSTLAAGTKRGNLPPAEGDFASFGFCQARRFPKALKLLAEAGIIVEGGSPAAVQGSKPVFIEIEKINPQKLHSFIKEIKDPMQKRKAMVALALFAGSLMSYQADGYPELGNYLDYGYGAYARHFKNNPALFARILARSASYDADGTGAPITSILQTIEENSWRINNFLKDCSLAFALRQYLETNQP